MKTPLRHSWGGGGGEERKSGQEKGKRNPGQLSNKNEGRKKKGPRGTGFLLGKKGGKDLLRKTIQVEFEAKNHLGREKKESGAPRVCLRGRGVWGGTPAPTAAVGIQQCGMKTTIVHHGGPLKRVMILVRGKGGGGKKRKKGKTALSAGAWAGGERLCGESQGGA